MRNMTHGNRGYLVLAAAAVLVGFSAGAQADPILVDQTWGTPWGNTNNGSEGWISRTYPSNTREYTPDFPITSFYTGPNAAGDAIWTVTPGANKVLVLEVNGYMGSNSNTQTPGTITYGGNDMTVAAFAHHPTSSGGSAFSTIYYLDLSSVTLNGVSFGGPGYSPNTPYGGNGPVLSGTNNTYEFNATAMVLSNVDTTNLPTEANGLAGVAQSSGNPTATITTPYTAGSLAVLTSSMRLASNLSDTTTWTTTDGTATNIGQGAELGSWTGIASRQWWGGTAYVSDLPVASLFTATSSVANVGDNNSAAVALFQPNTVPEPASLILLGLGALALLRKHGRREK